MLRCEVICQEYGLPVNAAPVPIFGQTGDNRYENVDKMILKQVDVLPHGLINNVEEKLGRDGGKLKEYIRWLAGRVAQLEAAADYLPTLHIDVYGTIGLIFEQRSAARGRLPGRSPGRRRGRTGCISRARSTWRRSRRRSRPCDRSRTSCTRMGSPVKIVADEWCNTLEDVSRFHRRRGLPHGADQDARPRRHPGHRGERAVLQGARHGGLPGRHVQRDRGLRAVLRAPGDGGAARRMLAKPGMGFDEGFTIVKNETERIRAVLKADTARDEFSGTELPAGMTMSPATVPHPVADGHPRATAFPRNRSAAASSGGRT